MLRATFDKLTNPALEWVHGTGQPIILYGATYTVDAAGKGLSYDRSDGAGGFDIFFGDTAGAAGTFTNFYCRNGIYFPTGLRVSGTADAATIFYTLPQPFLSVNKYTPSVMDLDLTGVGGGLVNKSASGVIDSSGVPILLHGLVTYTTGAGANIDVYNGTSTADTLVVSETGTNDVYDFFKYPKPIVLDSGGYVDIGANVDEYLAFYTRL